MPTLPGPSFIFPVQNAFQVKLMEFFYFSEFTKCVVAHDENIISNVTGMQGQKKKCSEKYGSHIVNSWLCVNSYLGCSGLNLAKQA